MPLSNSAPFHPLQNNQTFITTLHRLRLFVLVVELDFLLEVLVYLHFVFSSADLSSVSGTCVGQSAGLGSMMAPFAAGTVVLPQ
ncbi:hypothetical protein BGZ57DRAFT_907216 [Hyaloscypha finlandica]|nr:hypothetical protein BGZ57DRAFT_907216 [Hyaloscypha finlandica]